MQTLYEKIWDGLIAHKRLAGVLVGCFLFGLIFVICMQSPMNPFLVELPGVDSGVFHYVASVMQKGGLPYRDTFDHKGPLLYFINYLGLYINYYSGAWLLEFCALLAWIAITYKTARLFCRRIPACFVCLTASTALLSAFFGGNFPECYALPCIAGAFWIFTDYFRNNRVNAGRLVLCGGLLGCALMLKPNTISVWVAFCIAVLVQKCMQKRPRDLLGFLGFFLLGLGAVLIPIVIYLVSNGIFRDFLDAYFLLNFQYSAVGGEMSPVRLAVSFLRRSWGIPCLMIVVPCLLQKQTRSIYWFAWLGYLLLSLGMCSMSGNNYVYYTITLAPCYVAPLAYFLGKLKYDRENAYPLQALALAATAVFLFAWFTPTKTSLIKVLKPTSQVSLGDEHHQELIRLIGEYTDEDEPIIVYGNEDAFYFYSHRFAASKYSFQYPIIFKSEKIMNEFFAELDEKLPKLILVQSLWCDDEYIREFLATHPYECITDFDDYALYLRSE